MTLIDKELASFHALPSNENAYKDISKANYENIHEVLAIMEVLYGQER